MSEPSKCTICGKPQKTRLAPFCSKRCADVDLGRWLKGGYAIAGAAHEEQSEDQQNNEKSTPEDD